MSPADGTEAFSPFTFSWQPVEGATSYVVEVATDPSFDQVLARVTTSETQLSSKGMDLDSGVTHYWRVQASGAGHTNGISAVRSFTPTLLLITSPANGTKLLEGDVTVTWNYPDNETEATLTVALDDNIETIVYSTTSSTGEAVIPADALNPGTRYFIQVAMEYAGEQLSSAVNMFTTQFATPSFLVPLDGGVLYGDDYITVQPQSEATSYVIEVSTSATTWGRTRYVETITEGNQSSKMASEIKVASKFLEDGATYYARTRISYLNENNVSNFSAYCPAISFTYKAERPAWTPGDADGNGVIDVDDMNIAINIILGKTVDETTIQRADADGNGTVDIDDINLIINAILGKNVL